MQIRHKLYKKCGPENLPASKIQLIHIFSVHKSLRFLLSISYAKLCL